MLYLINLLYNHQGFGFGVFAYPVSNFLGKKFHDRGVLSGLQKIMDLDKDPVCP